MAPRRQFVLLLSAFALLLTPLVLVPRLAQAEPGNYRVDTKLDNLEFDTSTPVGTYCKLIQENDCSLRRALGEANRDGIASTISFAVQAQGTLTLDSGKGRLEVTAPNLLLDAIPVFPDTGIKVRLDGSGATFPGLTISSSSNTIKGLSITGFSGQLVPGNAGILLDGPNANDNVISGNFIGVLPDGVSIAGNLYGVRIINGAARNTITGLNIIGGSTVAGVLIENSDDNTVASSSLGIGVGNVPLFNGEAGVIISSSAGGTSTGNTIGGISSSLANTISGNGPLGRTDRAGILLTGAGTTGNFIRANRIGLSADGTARVPNSGDGIRIENGASANDIVGTLAAPVIVSGNNGYGIRVTGTGTFSNTIGPEVYVGLNGDRTGGVGNDRGGIAIDTGATTTTVTNSTVAGNSGGPGIYVSGGASAGTLISNSFIGRLIDPNSSALLTLPNQVGIQIVNAGSTSVLTNTIGNNAQAGLQVQGTSPVTVTANALVGNTQAGVQLEGARNAIVFTNTITGNLQTGLLLRGAVGTSVLSNTVAANQGGGILLESSAVSRTTLTALTGNIVSGNDRYGVRLTNTLTTTLLRNYIGLTLVGGLPNSGNGLEIFDAGNTVGTDTYVAGHSNAGIVVSGTSTLSTSFNKTVVGLAFATSGFTETLANGGPGLVITGGARNTTFTEGTIAGAATGPGDPPGVQIAGTSGVTVTLMRIGWVPQADVDGATPLPRPFGVGVSVTGPLTNVNLLTNTLRFNRGLAIAVSGNAQRVKLFGNRLSQNGAAIDLDPSNPLIARPPTTDPVAATNPNHDIDPPPVDVLNFTDPLRLRVTDQGIVSGFIFTSTSLLESSLSPVSACVTCTIQVFRPADGLTDGQGWVLLNTRSPTNSLDLPAEAFRVTNANGSFTRQIAGGFNINSGQLLLVATDGFGNSSEYAVFPVSTTLGLENLSGDQSAGPGQTVTYSLRLSNPGTLDLTGLKLLTNGTLAEWRPATTPLTDTIFATAENPLGARDSRLLTVTLTLPPGRSEQARVGTTDLTTVTVIKDGTTLSQSVRLQTTVLGQPGIEISPTVSLLKARPGQAAAHPFAIRNNGNVTVTVTLARQTIDPPAQPGPWTTTLNTDTFTLVPGGIGQLLVSVSVPMGTLVNDNQGNPVRAQTLLVATAQVTPTAPLPPVIVPFTATTGVDLIPDAELLNGGQQQNSAAGRQVTFIHTARNTSNGTARFCTLWTASRGSTIRFESRSSGFAVDASGCFTLGRLQEGQLAAIVTVNSQAAQGTSETIRLTLRNEDTATVINSASVSNQINLGRVPQPARFRVWLPQVQR